MRVLIPRKPVFLEFPLPNYLTTNWKLTLSQTAFQGMGVEGLSSALLVRYV